MLCALFVRDSVCGGDFSYNKTSGIMHTETSSHERDTDSDKDYTDCHGGDAYLKEEYLTEAQTRDKECGSIIKSKH